MVDDTERRNNDGDYYPMVFGTRSQAFTYGLNANRRGGARAGESWLSVPTSKPDTRHVPECIRGRW